jgi:hypothetical protein
VDELGSMSHRQLVEWSVFEEDFGPLTVHERIDANAALISHAIVNALTNGQAGDVADYGPRWESAEPKAHIVDWLSAIATKAD